MFTSGSHGFVSKVVFQVLKYKITRNCVKLHLSSTELRNKSLHVTIGITRGRWQYEGYVARITCLTCLTKQRLSGNVVFTGQLK